MKQWTKLSLWIVLAGTATYVFYRYIGPSVAAVIFVLFILIGQRGHVDDEVLIANLEKDSGKYELLISMFREDAPLAVAHPTWISPDKSISAERWKEYKALFKELQLDAGMRYYSLQFIEGERHKAGESIEFISTAQGLVTGGSSKGYVYRPESPSPLFDSLDEARTNLESGTTGYRRINDEWYITFVWYD